MTTQQIAENVSELLRQGNFEAVYDNYFEAQQVQHIEPQSPFFPNLTGVDSIKAKDAQMQANIASVESLEVGTPIIAKSHFALPYKVKIQMKDGQVMALDEIIVYEIKDGKIILEQFFY
ncbi:MAG: SnoaL-like domain-containing protein [Salibacteraceae bacterium]